MSAKRPTYTQLISACEALADAHDVLKRIPPSPQQKVRLAAVQKVWDELADAAEAVRK